MSSHSDGWRIQLSAQQSLQLQLVKHDAKLSPGGHLLRRGGNTLHSLSVRNPLPSTPQQRSGGEWLLSELRAGGFRAAAFLLCLWSLN